MKNIGMVDTKFLKKLMENEQLSEREFAQKIGISHTQVNRVLNHKRNAGNKFIFGVLSVFPHVTYGELIPHDRVLPKGNERSETA